MTMEVLPSSIQDIILSAYSIGHIEYPYEKNASVIYKYQFQMDY